MPRVKPVPVLLCLSQILHGLACFTILGLSCERLVRNCLNHTTAVVIVEVVVVAVVMLVVAVQVGVVMY